MHCWFILLDEPAMAIFSLVNDGTISSVRRLSDACGSWGERRSAWSRSSEFSWSSRRRCDRAWDGGDAHCRQPSRYAHSGGGPKAVTLNAQAAGTTAWFTVSACMSVPVQHLMQLATRRCGPRTRIRTEKQSSRCAAHVVLSAPVTTRMFPLKFPFFRYIWPRLATAGYYKM